MDGRELADHALLIRDGRIAWIGAESELVVPTGAIVHDAAGGCVMPGLIDAHTHTVFAGDRMQEFAWRSAGRTYEEIAERGGGIWRTVQATRAASAEALFALGQPRLREMARRGVTTLEIKSGYGLDEANERKLLEVAGRLGEWSGIEVARTFLAAHVVPRDFAGDRQAYVAASLAWLDRIARDRLCEAVDVFVDASAFGPDDARATAAAARALGLGVRLHVDQLTAGAGAELAAELGALSADHLEHLSDAGAAALGRAGVVATLVPYATLFVGRGARPNVGRLRAHAVPMAVATDFNPGSSPVLDLHATAALAIGLFGLTVDEALRAITANAARALGRADTHGVLRVGAVADVLILDRPRPEALFYELGRNPVRVVLKGGKTPTVLA